MEPIKSSTRGLFEILMPGVFLLLNLLLTFFLLLKIVADAKTQNEILGFLSNPAYAVSLLLSFGYLIGVAARLLRTRELDHRSARLIALLCPSQRETPYLRGTFFYREWMIEKCRTRLPAAVARFYSDYWADKDVGEATANTTFFNFCKAIVNKVDPRSAQEVHAAEAMIRFVTGSYYALFWSMLLALIDVVLCLILSWPLVFLPLGLAAVYALLLVAILTEFRYLRLKEVETVFTACYANEDAFAKLMPTSNDRAPLSRPLTGDVERAARQRLLEATWQGSLLRKRLPALDLEELISRMRSESRVHQCLSSLYFAGGDVDHPYFLENNKVAIGLAVLPEDSKKASQRKRHPTQVEVVFVVQGELVLNVRLQDGTSATSTVLLQEGQHSVIPQNACHWITAAPGKQAAFFFVKTNPCAAPRSEDCQGQ